MIKKIPYYFTKDFSHWNKVDFFRSVVYAFLLLNTLSLLPIAQELWGYSGIVGTRGWNTDVFWPGSAGFINILSHPANSYNTWVFIVFILGQLFFLITGILRVFPILSSVMIYFFTVNLFLKGYLAFTGGEVLMNILLFYLMFIHRSDKMTGPFLKRYRESRVKKPEFSPIQNTLNNTFFLIILIQICFVYFFSTFYKLLDPYWVSGEAVMFTSRIPIFSSNFMEWLFGDNLVLSMIATYTTLLYQGLFSILVWTKKFKTPLLLFGVFFHLMISFGMGIFSFGIIMILSYIPFLEDRQIEQIKRIFRIKRKSTDAV